MNGASHSMEQQPDDADDDDNDHSPLVQRSQPASTSCSTLMLRDAGTLAASSQARTTSEDFVQNPYDKLVLRGKLPYKLLLNLTVLCLLVAQVAWVEVESARSEFNEVRALKTWLLSSSTPSSGTPATLELPYFYLYKSGQLVDVVDKFAENFFSAAVEALADVDYYAAGSASRSPNATKFDMLQSPILTATFSPRSFRFDATSASCDASVAAVVSSTLSQGVSALDFLRGPASNNSFSSIATNDMSLLLCAPRRDVLDPSSVYLPCRRQSPPGLVVTPEDLLCEATVTAELRQTLHSSSPDAVFSRTSSRFDIALNCKRTSFGAFRCSMAIDTQVSRSHARVHLAVLQLVALVVCSLLDIALRVKALRKLYSYRALQQLVDLSRTADEANDGRSTSSSTSATEPVDSIQPEAPFEAKWNEALLKDLGESWHFWAIACHICTCGYAALAACEAFEVSLTTSASYAKRMVLGGACFASSLQFLGFLRFFRRVYFLIKATRRSIPRLAPFLAGAAPIFFGSACFATIVFGSHSGGEFETLGSSAISLLTAMFGDSLLRAFERAGDVSSRPVQAAAVIFLVLYILLFMSAILNVALATVMEVYTDLREDFGVVLHNDEDDEHQHRKHLMMPRKLISGLQRRPAAERWEMAKRKAIGGLEELERIAAELEAGGATRESSGIAREMAAVSSLE